MNEECNRTHLHEIRSVREQPVLVFEDYRHQTVCLRELTALPKSLVSA